MDTSKFYFNRDLHIEIGEELNAAAASKNVTVSRWENNSNHRNIITYIVHTGERAARAVDQTGVLFTTSVDAGRNRRVTDETGMMQQVAEFLATLPAPTAEPVYVNRDERYGNAEIVTVSDYAELNPEGEFEQRADGIYEHVQSRFGEWVRVAAVR